METEIAQQYFASSPPPPAAQQSVAILRAQQRLQQPLAASASSEDDVASQSTPPRGSLKQIATVYTNLLQEIKANHTEMLQVQKEGLKSIQNVSALLARLIEHTTAPAPAAPSSNG